MLVQQNHKMTIKDRPIFELYMPSDLYSYHTFSKLCIISHYSLVCVLAVSTTHTTHTLLLNNTSGCVVTLEHVCAATFPNKTPPDVGRENALQKLHNTSSVLCGSAAL